MSGERRGTFTMLITADKHIVLITRKWRSKWWTATCGCRRRRKDGTCKHLRAVLEDPRLRPDVKPRIRLDPLPMGDQTEAKPESVTQTGGNPDGR